MHILIVLDILELAEGDLFYIYFRGSDFFDTFWAETEDPIVDNEVVIAIQVLMLFYEISDVQGWKNI